MTQDIERIDRIISLLKVIWLKEPDLRFNQLIENIKHEYCKASNSCLQEFKTFKKVEMRNSYPNEVYEVSKFSVPELFYLEDSKFEEFLKSMRKDRYL